MPIQRRVAYPGNWMFNAYRYWKPHDIPNYTTPKENDKSLTGDEWMAYHCMHELIDEWVEKNKDTLMEADDVVRTEIQEALQQYVRETAEEFFKDGKKSKGLKRIIAEKKACLAQERYTISQVQSAIYNSRVFKEMNDKGTNPLLKKGKLRYFNCEQLFEQLDSYFSNSHFEDIRPTILTWLAAGAGLVTLEELKGYTTLTGLQLGILVFCVGVMLYIIDEFIVKPIMVERTKEKILTHLGTDSDGNQRELPDMYAEQEKNEHILLGLGVAQKDLCEKPGKKGGLIDKREQMAERINGKAATI